MTHFYDIIVIGGGHAGCEAAAAAARMGCKTLLITMNMPTIGQMSCNPAMGGLAKGQLVKEVDALGGEIGYVTDIAMLQFRMLNRSKGPAVWSPRAQCDRGLYARSMRRNLEQLPNLDIKQNMVVDVLTEGGRISGVVCESGARYECKAVILCAGTFLNGRIFTGEWSTPAGRVGEAPALHLSENLIRKGFEIGRLKTGTPPRLEGRTIDYAKCAEQPGDERIVPFSHRTKSPIPRQLCCHLTYTHPKTHEILRKGLTRSPLYTGRIKGTGPRYCPSIEDKIVRFAERERHQLFLEPEGWETSEVYVNGFSSSLPEEIQFEALRTIPGLEHVEMMRPGYAVEYDFFPPHQIHYTLETRIIEGLYFAGNINGTTGYEEAAAQGFIAGVNAALRLRGEEPLVLLRDQAYIGVLVDDLITRVPDEPYRMFTSRAEHRLLLRQDNADLRLMDIGFRLGLVEQEHCDRLMIKKRRLEETEAFLETTRSGNGEKPELKGETFAAILKRPEYNIYDILSMIPKDSLPDDAASDDDLLAAVELEIKYAGYIGRQRERAEQMARMEGRRIPYDIDYSEIRSLSAEGREKLMKFKPLTLGQAGRIAGVSPADLAVLMICLRRREG
jgi:tRNA uridine 5-carboxymethylaminomethyl modification enzyme